MPDPFLLYRDGAGGQVVLQLDGELERLTIGRREGSDVALPWDAQVSRLHAELVRMGDDWVLCDDGVSHNGTFVNGERLRGRRRLRGGDAVSVGDTVIAFCEPTGDGSSVPTRTVGGFEPVSLTPAQRRVLAALCRPLDGPGYAAPASNQQIADELVITVDAVKRTLTALFDRFDLQDLPQNQKRAALAARGRGLLQR